MGSSPKPPKQPTPEESASAAVQAAQAGDIYQAANAPVTGYADLYTQAMLGPSRAQLAQGLTNQQQLQSAQAQLDIQSRLDPQAYAMRKMNETVAASRLGKLYGMDPSAFMARYPEAYATPTAGGLPDVRQLAQAGQGIGGLLTGVSLTKGGTPQMGGQAGGGTVPTSGYPSSQLPSYLGI